MRIIRTLYATVGLPRSGKSTWAKQSGLPVVCPDAIRLALHGEAFIDLAEPFVWAIAKTMVRALFEAGHDAVVLDACNATAKRRADWIMEGVITRWVVFDALAIYVASVTGGGTKSAAAGIDIELTRNTLFRLSSPFPRFQCSPQVRL